MSVVCWGKSRPNGELVVTGPDLVTGPRSVEKSPNRVTRFLE